MSWRTLTGLFSRLSCGGRIVGGTGGSEAVGEAEERQHHLRKWFRGKTVPWSTMTMASGMAGMMDFTNGLGVEGEEACGI